MRWSIHPLVGESSKHYQPSKFKPKRPATVLRASSSKLARFLKRATRFAKPGDRVLIKPNINSDDKFPGTSRPAFLKALIGALLDRGAKVEVGDMSGLSWANTKRDATKTGIAQAVEETGVPLLCFERYGWIRLNFGKPLGDIWVTEKLADYDHIVNSAVLKTHRVADFTLSLKAVMGTLHPLTRIKMHDIDVKTTVPQASLAWTPTINIIDGHRCFIEGGPDLGVEAAPGVLLASEDRVALDVTAVQQLQKVGSKSLAGMDIWRHPQIAGAIKLGLGISSQKDIKIERL